MIVIVKSKYGFDNCEHRATIVELKKLSKKLCLAYMIAIVRIKIWIRQLRTSRDNCRIEKITQKVMLNVDDRTCRIKIRIRQLRTSRDNSRIEKIT
jgi:hypothetical protein